MKKTSSTNAEIIDWPTVGHDVVQSHTNQLIGAAQRAVRAALREHKLAGNPVAVWRNGQVVLLPPEQIEA